MVPGEKWQPEGSRKLVTSYEKLKDVCREKGERKIAQEGGSERRVEWLTEEPGRS